MNIKFWLNGIQRQEEVDPGMLLIDFLREKGCYSVKRGCETANCGLCTVLMDETTDPFLLHARCKDRWKEDRDIGRTSERGSRSLEAFLANEGAEQCGFCNPGFIMNVIAMLRELEEPDRRTDQGISCRKSVQMFRFCLPDRKHPEIP